MTQSVSYLLCMSQRAPSSHLTTARPRAPRKIARGVRFDPDVISRLEARAVAQNDTFSDLVNAIVKRSVARAA